jgi:hypothetical protein
MRHSDYLPATEQDAVAAVFGDSTLDKLYDQSREVRAKASNKTFHSAEGIIISIIVSDRYHRYIVDGKALDNPTDEQKAEADYVIENCLVTFRLNGKGTDSGIIPLNQIKNPRDEYFKTPAEFLFREYTYEEDGKHGKKGDRRLNLHAVTVTPSKLTDEEKLAAAGKAGFTMFTV